MNRLKFLYLWSVGVGAMDAATGLLLIFAPARVLKMLFIAAPPQEAWVFLSWMGVFITGVGLSYGYVFKGAREAEVAWRITAKIRLLVGAFLCWKICTGDLAPAWVLVACTDLAVAAGQMIFLKLGWWKGARG